MQAAIVYSILFFIMACSSCTKYKSQEISPSELVGKGCDKPDIFTVKISNQSTSLEVIDIKASIDGKLIVDDEFECAGQHYWKYYDFKLCYGKHTLSATSKRGEANIQTTFEFTKDTSIANLTYWYYDEKHSDSTPRRFKFEMFDEEDCELRETQFYVQRCKEVKEIEASDKEKRIRKKLEEFK